MILPLIMTTLASKGRATSDKLFDYFAFSPLYLDADSTMVMKTTRGKFSFNVYISNDLYTKKIIYQSKTVTAGTFTYTYDNAYTREANTITVDLKVGTQIVSSKSITMNVSNPKRETIVDNKPITTDSILTTFLPDKSVNTTKITYTFTNFDGLYVPDYYHKVKLDDFAIKLPVLAQPFFNCNPSLVIKNVDGVFNGVSKTNNVEFPLKLVKTLTGYTFELKDNLYVNKETLLLSSVSKAGYVKTKHIYFPRNDMRNQDKYSAYFVFTDFGIDRDLVKHTFEFRALKNIIGDCHNSEYCIERRVR